MKNMSRRRFWAGKAWFYEIAVLPIPVPNSSSVPQEPDPNRAHSIAGLKIAKKRFASAQNLSH